MPFVINGTTGINLGTQPLTGSLPDANAPSGSVLQVVSSTKTDTASFTSSTFADVTGLSVTITPISSSSRFLIIASVASSWQGGIAKIGGRLVRDSTVICVGDSASNRTRVSGAAYWNIQADVASPVSVNFLDSPATASAITYKWQVNNMDNNGTVYVNRAGSDPDFAYTPRATSTITVMEIAG